MEPAAAVVVFSSGCGMAAARLHTVHDVPHMKRVAKILLGVLGVLILLIVAAAIALPLLVDPNDYKPQINAAIEDQIGREVDISGDIGLSVFPWLGVELGRVSVANADGFGDEPMATMEAAEISVKLLPLLSREIEVGTVGLQGLNLRLARNADGRTNWASISEHLTRNQAESGNGESPAESEPKNDPAPDDGGFSLSSLQIGAIDIRDAAVSWRDATTGTDYRASGVKLVTGRLTDGEPVRLEFGGDFEAPEAALAGEVNLVAQVEPSIVDQFYRFSDLSLNVIASGEAVPAGRQQASLTGAGEFDLDAGRFKLSNMALQAAGLNVNANADGSDLGTDAAAYSGRVTVKEFNPRAVMRELEIEPPATQRDAALSTAGFDAQFDAGNDHVQFKQILATLDDSSVKGSARVEDFAQPAIGFDLSLDELNVDNYLPPGSAEQAKNEAPAETGGGAEQKAAEIDLSMLEDLRLDGKLSADSLTAANIHVTNADLAVRARDGVLTIEPLTAELYEGNVRVTATVDASRETPRYSLAGNLNGLRFAPLLADVAGTERVDALANMSLDLTTSGRQVAAMKRALDGSLGFDLRDGAFNGFNLADLIAAARSRLGGDDTGEASTALGDDKRTPFSRFAGQFNVTDGVLAGKDLNLTTRLLNATGAGSYDLADNALDYTVNARVPEDADGTLERLAGVTVPIRLSGNLLSPDYRLDVAGALKGVAEKRLSEEKSKLADKVREKIEERTGGDEELGGRLQRGIESLFGGGDEREGDDSQDESR